MSNIPEEYGGAKALNYGDPYTPRERIYCSCGKLAQCYGATNGFECFECAKKEFEDLTDKEAAALLGFVVIDDV